MTGLFAWISMAALSQYLLYFFTYYSHQNISQSLSSYNNLTYANVAQFSLNNVHKRGLKHTFTHKHTNMRTYALIPHSHV